MSEKIYTWLLRLYPAEFREKYGAEALQLYRDRVRDEKGFLAGAWLWLDLLVDLATSLPKEHLYHRAEFAAAPPPYGADGIPTFCFLSEESLRPGALLFGTLFSSAALVTFSVLLGYAGSHATSYSVPGQVQGEMGFPEHDTGPAGAQSAAVATNRSESKGMVRMDASEHRRVVQSAASILRQHYVDRENGQKMANALLQHEKNGDYDRIADGAALAALMTSQMREVSADRHLRLEYSAAPLPEQPDAPTPEDIASYQTAMKEQNCTFEKVAVLPQNIGYLKLNSFPDVAVCEKAAEEALGSLHSADAIIFDLRDNRGGEPAMVRLIARYLFDHPEYMYNPRENTTEQNWTRSPVPGNRLADKPVYVLTSASTVSAAEHFTYDLKMLRRATVVGERTAGAAHSGVWHRIDDHFGMGVPETKAINPFGSTDWAEVGVEPDVKVEAANALEAALRLARGKLGKK